jgi:hypothetical protein
MRSKEEVLEIEEQMDVALNNYDKAMRDADALMLLKAQETIAQLLDRLDNNEIKLTTNYKNNQ